MATSKSKNIRVKVKSKNQTEKLIYTQSDLDKILKQKDMLLSTYSKIAKQPLVNTENVRQSALSYNKFSKENIIKYLQSPQTNATNIRNASIYMFINSSHYRRLIEYYAKMPLWTYILMPYKYDNEKIIKDKNKYIKSYFKTAQYLENMNIKHEFLKVMMISLVEDMFYGICWETSDSFFMQRINPDWCIISSVEDGIYNYAIDMSKIKEEELMFYPQEITNMWNDYQSTGYKYQEVPTSISACFKMNETVGFPLPIFSGTMTNLHDIEDYKMLLKQKTEIANYKILNMKIPTDKDGEFTRYYEDMSKFYNLLFDVVPEGVGISMSPSSLESVEFEKNGGLSETNEVIKAEQEFWSASGTSGLLFGSGNKTSVASLRLSIQNDEEIVIGFMRQVERWINRRLKNYNGAKFKVQILPATIFNQENLFKIYKESATLGLPTKSIMSALNGLEPIDVASMCTLENDILNFPDNFIPLSSSYTQSSKESGRPTNKSQGKDLTESGTQTAEDDQNNAR